MNLLDVSHFTFETTIQPGEAPDALTEIDTAYPHGPLSEAVYRGLDNSGSPQRRKRPCSQGHRHWNTRYRHTRAHSEPRYSNRPRAALESARANLLNSFGYGTLTVGQFNTLTASGHRPLNRAMGQIRCLNFIQPWLSLRIALSAGATKQLHTTDPITGHMRFEKSEVPD